MRFTQMILGALLLAAGMRVVKAEVVENPMYVAWSKVDVGTTVSFDVMELPKGERSPCTFRLVEVTKEAVVVEFAPSHMGKQRVILPATIEKDDMAVFLVPKELRRELVVKNPFQVEEKMTVAGKPAEATCYVASVGMVHPPGPADAPVQAQTWKVWVVASIVGGVVKMELTDPAANGGAPHVETLTYVGSKGPEAAGAASQAAGSQPATKP